MLVSPLHACYAPCVPQVRQIAPGLTSSLYAAQISEGHRRNAITYTSLICVAEKAGQWALALELFHRVAADGVGPNAAIFNAAMSACAQGARPALKSALDAID